MRERFSWCWLIHLASLLGCAIWVMFDLRLESMIRTLVACMNLGNEESYRAVWDHAGSYRFIVFAILLVSGGISLIWLALQNVRGRGATRVRSVGSLMAFTGTVALWLTLAANHHSLAWQGQRLRVAAHLGRLESIAEPLRADWPVHDGEMPDVGPFMAYPFGRPSTLILLHAPNASIGGPHIAAVDRSAEGALRLQLTGTGRDDWAEWHPAGSQPRSFVGGLQDGHVLLASAKLPMGWHLVRYESPLNQ